MTLGSNRTAEQIVSANRQFVGDLSIVPSSVSVADAPADFLAGFKTVFLEASVALDAARKAGLDQDARVLSTSPALTLGTDPQVEELGQHFSGRLMWDYMEAMHDLSISLFQAFSKNPSLHQFAATVARRSLYFCSHYLVKSVILREADFQEPRAVVLVQTGDSYLDTVINPPWAELLADNDQLKIMHIEQPAQVEADQHPGRMERLKMAPLARLYRLARIMSNRMPYLFRRGNAYVLTENELLRETAVVLALRGYRIHQLQTPDMANERLPDQVERAMHDVVTPLLDATLAAWTPPSAVPRLKALFMDQLQTDIVAQNAAEESWNNKLRELVDNRPALILTNYPKAAYGPGFGRMTRRFGIPLVAFQHGLGREFGAAHFVGGPGYENVVADHVVVYNDESVRITDAIPFGVGKAYAAGLPDEFRRAGHYRPMRKDAPPLIYVSTNVYAGNRRTPSGELTDTQRARQELSLVEDVLQHLPHRVTFKTYPDRQYWDDSPVVERAREISNIDVFDRRQSLRFLLPDARLILTSRATSTIGNCMMSGKPVVFIDYPDQQPLKPEARGAFRDGLFFFDGGAADFTLRLREFLSQSLTEIERQWREKSAGRQVLIRRYFTKADRRAGRAAANHLVAIARQALAERSSGDQQNKQGGTP